MEAQTISMPPAQKAYVMTRVLDTPFWSIYNLLPIFLFKDLHATPYQLGILIAIKPLVSLLSSYWSTKVQQNPDKILSSITLGRFLAYFPFIFFPFIDSVWYFIFCFGIYMLLQVGMVPAWMELLKQNLPANTRDKVFSYTQVFGYLGGGLLPFLFGWILDARSESWRWIFPVTALIAWSAFFWQKAIIFQATKPHEDQVKPPHLLLHPWKNAWDLLKRRPDFANFQIGFMLIGSGLMIIQPTLPVFFISQLNLNYTEMGVAIMLCKGIGFACSSSMWVRLLQRANLFYFGALIASLAVLFPVFLMAAQYQIVCLYIAYLVYGFMQSGNELSWNMSGPIFAGKENSAPFSTVNIIAIGVRGLFVPLIGAYCLEHFGSFSVIFLSGVLCFLAAVKMAYESRSKNAFKISDQNVLQQ